MITEGIENTAMKEGEVESKFAKERKKFACPHCEKDIGWANVSTYYASVIGSRNPGRNLSTEEAKRMVCKRWADKKAKSGQGTSVPVVAELPAPIVENTMGMPVEARTPEDAPFTPDVMARLEGK